MQNETQYETLDGPEQLELNLFRNTFVNEVLESHNSCRRRHGSPNLELDQRLIHQSQECADHLLYMDTIHASRFENVGENIYVMHVQDAEFHPKGEYAVDAWYQQKDTTTCGMEPENNNSVNFSQLIWKTTRHLGVGIARNESKIVIVCQYFPPGNIAGRYVDNVLPETEAVLPDTETTNTAPSE